MSTPVRKKDKVTDTSSIMGLPPDYGGPGMPREPGMMEPWEKPVTSTHAGTVVDHLQASLEGKIVEDDPRFLTSQATAGVKGEKPRWHQHTKKKKG